MLLGANNTMITGPLTVFDNQYRPFATAGDTSIIAAFASSEEIGGSPPVPTLFVSLRVDADETAMLSWFKQIA